jgi:hypothetical protein
VVTPLALTKRLFEHRCCGWKFTGAKVIARTRCTRLARSARYPRSSRRGSEIDGLLAGIAGVAALASALRALLYGVAPLDPAVMTGSRCDAPHGGARRELRSGATRDAHRFEGGAAPGVSRISDRPSSIVVQLDTS